MKDFAGKIAVVTGGGSGMGREMVRQLVAEGASVAMCDVNFENMAETKRLAEADGAPQGTKITTHLCDVSIEEQILKFRDEVARDLDTDKIHLLINNAGIGGGGSLFTTPRAAWEKTFDVCFYGVVWGVRAFLPMLQKASEAHIVNVSSVNGFWASVGPGIPHTAYSAAKFAVKGFTEALMTDLEVNAPHIKCSVVMPGHIGTSIVANSRSILSDGAGMSDAEKAQLRARLKSMGMAADQIPDAGLEALVEEQARRFRDDAPTSAAQAATIILDGVKAGRWRILVGEDAHRLDERVRANPEGAYNSDFFELFGPAVRGGR